MPRHRNPIVWYASIAPLKFFNVKACVYLEPALLLLPVQAGRAVRAAALRAHALARARARVTRAAGPV